MRGQRRSASAPAAPASVPARLYQAKLIVRAEPATVCASAACSVGRNTLTSPADGFSVPATATISSGQKSVTPAKPIPVSTISAEAPSRIRRRDRR